MVSLFGFGFSEVCERDIIRAFYSLSVPIPSIRIVVFTLVRHAAKDFSAHDVSSNPFPGSQESSAAESVNAKMNLMLLWAQKLSRQYSNSGNSAGFESSVPLKSAIRPVQETKKEILDLHHFQSNKSIG